jgi:hypothetical protein
VVSDERDGVPPRLRLEVALRVDLKPLGSGLVVEQDLVETTSTRR